ncbi:hypothetical protein AACH06_11080 [Ideonella sp. DXS29W]|uniref:Uncharacterized protein n=1 Tax=Ideonella lacteola TaxID=2984193 RepID=A0ABU9BN17_9BURK
MPPSSRQLWLRRAALAGAAAALALVFVAYRSPELMLDVADRVWACF